MTPEEHLIEAGRHLAAALTAVTAPPKPVFPDAVIPLKPWCGNCSDAENREVYDHERRVVAGRCPDCHPFPISKRSIRQCRFCGVPVSWGRLADGSNGWADEAVSPGCAHSNVEFTHQPL